jgi:hypothetical protein
MATTPPVGSSNVSSLSDWAGGYVTDMLGKAQAIADQPYQVYQGPMTAGESGLQSKVFQGLGSLNFPSNLGQSFASPMGRQQYGQQPYPSQMPQQGGGMPEDIQKMQSYAAMGIRPITQTEDMRIAAQQLGNPNATPQQGGGMLTPYSGGRPTDVMGGDYTGGKGFSPDTNNPLFAGVGAMPPTGESSIGSVGYAAPTTGGGTTTLSGMGGPMGMMPQQGGIAGLTPPPPQGSQQPSNIAQSYMNPYLQSVLNPQMDELRRQNEITNMQANAKLTGAGAFGGGRQAIMNAENARNLMMEQNKTVGQGYANAYDKAMGQFNTEQGQARDLANLMSTQGAQQRDIEQQGISADYNEFLAQRDYPMKQTQYLQSMLQGLPISTVSNQAAQQSGIGQLSSTVGGLGNIMESLKKLGL